MKYARRRMRSLACLTSFSIPPLNPEQREYAHTIVSGGESLLYLINNILDFSRIDSGHFEPELAPLSLRDCIESAIEELAIPANAKGLELLYRLEDCVPESVLGDMARIRQILVNLIDNAVKFTEHSEILVTVSVAPVVPWEIHGQLRFSVRDTGIGIPFARFHRLFKTFSRVDTSSTRKYGGTGLGFSICNKLVACMGGRIRVESIPDRGSDFRFDLPLPPTPSLQYAPPLPPALTCRSQGFACSQ